MGLLRMRAPWGDWGDDRALGYIRSRGRSPRITRSVAACAARLPVAEPREPEFRLLHRCFDNWRGIGDVVASMARQGYDLELRRYNGRGWRALFFREDSSTR